MVWGRAGGLRFRPGAPLPIAERRGEERAKETADDKGRHDKPLAKVVVPARAAAASVSGSSVGERQQRR